MHDQIDLDNWEGLLVNVHDTFIGTRSKPAWRCRRCGWTIVTAGLPLPHRCEDRIAQGKKDADEPT